MIYSYNECIAKFGSCYALKKAVADKKIFKIKEGLYTTEKEPRELEIFVKTHKDAVFTMYSAFYYLGISDHIPEKYYVATDKDASKYNSPDVIQYFMNNGLINYGKETIQYTGIDIPIFNKERMLIELIRYKNKIPFDYYKEIVSYYRNHINDLNVSLLFEYLEFFPKKNSIFKAIQLEIL